MHCPGLPLTVHMQDAQYLCVLATYVSYDTCAIFCALLLDLIVIDATGYFVAYIRGCEAICDLSDVIEHASLNVLCNKTRICHSDADDLGCTLVLHSTD